MGWWQRLKDLLGRRLAPDDRAFVEEYLDEAGLFLFNQMSVADQRHAVRVAQSIIREVSFRRGIDLKTLIQAALLHDIGKVKGEINWFHRIAVGICRRLAPGSRRNWASADRETPFRYALYVDLIHPARGAYMAESFGLSEEVTSLIRSHHDSPNHGPSQTGQGVELQLLKHADKRN